MCILGWTINFEMNIFKAHCPRVCMSFCPIQKINLCARSLELQKKLFLYGMFHFRNYIILTSSVSPELLHFVALSGFSRSFACKHIHNGVIFRKEHKISQLYATNAELFQLFGKLKQNRI